MFAQATPQSSAARRAADRRSPTPSSRASRASRACPELERDPAHDQRGEDQKERRGRSRRRGSRTSPGRRRRWLRRRSAATPRCRPRPGRSCGSIMRLSVSSRPRAPEQHADAEIEALEDEVADPQHADQANQRVWRKLGSRTSSPCSVGEDQLGALSGGGRHRRSMRLGSASGPLAISRRNRRPPIASSTP